MLLEGRFLFLRFLLGVRIVAAHDELVDGPNGPERLIGWSYATLDGHLEQGKLRYEIAKEIDTGRVEFRIIAYSRWSPIANRLVWAGFNLMGRRTQLTWYHHAMTRLRRLLDDPPPTPSRTPTASCAHLGGRSGAVRGIRHPVRAPRPRHAASRPRPRSWIGPALLSDALRGSRRPRGNPAPMRPFDDITRIERAQVLDKPVAAVRAVVTSVLRNRTVKDALHGVWLGHPLHPGPPSSPPARCCRRRCSTRSARRWVVAGCRRRSSSRPASPPRR